jgi:hypothetical protein
MGVTDYLERARECAAIADKKTGDEKKRMLEIADAWLKLAGEAADEAIKSGSLTGKLPEHPKVS